MTYQFSNTLELLIDNYQGKFSVVPGADFISPAQTDKSRNSNDTGLTYEPQKNLDFPSWEDVLQNCSQGVGSQPEALGDIPNQGYDILGEPFTNSFGERKEFGSQLQTRGEWQVGVYTSVWHLLFTSRY